MTVSSRKHFISEKVVTGQRNVYAMDCLSLEQVIEAPYWDMKRIFMKPEKAQLEALDAARRKWLAPRNSSTSYREPACTVSIVISW